LSLFVVDESVVARWFVPERLSDDAVRLLADKDELASPDLMWAEIGNVLWKKARAGSKRSES
jgi:predicted nucleic acid-binding protein